jgi:single-strand DNA-binding protein
VKKMGDSGVSVLNFSLVTNRTYKNASWEKIEEAEFHRCVVFAGLADMMGQYLEKGRKIFVEWRLRTRQWEDQSWNKRYTTEIVVTDMNFCDSKASWTSANSNNTTSSEESTTEDDIPF